VFNYDRLCWLNYDHPLGGEGGRGLRFPGVSRCSTPRLLTLSPLGLGEGAGAGEEGYERVMMRCVE